MIKATDKSGKSRIYAGIAEAAKALGVDASNIGKVLRGLRQTVGGVHFERTNERPTTKAGRSKVKKQKAASKRKRLLDSVHDTLKELNQRYQNAKKEGQLATDPILQHMMQHTQYFGGKKSGEYKISMEHLLQFNDRELQNLLNMLHYQEGKYAKQAEEGVGSQSTAGLAAIFGISMKQATEYKDIIPLIFDLYHLAKTDVFFRYDDVVESTRYVLKEGAPPEDVEKWIDQIYSAYLGNDTDALADILNDMQEYGKDPEYSNKKDYEEGY